jgi:RNA polymerase sigma-70 factor, ECF subfamily
MVLAKTSAEGLSDEALFAQFQESGSQEAFGALVARHTEGLLLYIRRKVRGLDEAEDILQDVWLDLSLLLEPVQPPQKVKAILVRKAQFKAIDHHRSVHGRNGRPKRTVHPLSDLPLWDERQADPAEQCAATETFELVMAGIPKLKSNLAAALDLCMQDLGNEEAAALLGISVGVYRTRLWAARSKLRELI